MIGVAAWPLKLKEAVKRSRVVWLVAVLLTSCLALLVLVLPARWVLPWLQPRMHGLVLEQVRGTVWNGYAKTLRAPDGRPLGTLRWALSRRALWGAMDLLLDLEGPRLVAHGRLQRDAQGRLLVEQVAARADLAAWEPLIDSSLGVPQGWLELALPHVLLQGGWPLEVQGQARWRDASMRARAGSVALGTLVMDLQGASGVLQGRLHDEPGGPLAAAGRWQASPLGWRLDLRLQPRTRDPMLRRWLAQLAVPAADGAIELHRRGGLAATTEASP